MTILDEIIARTREDLEISRLRVPEAQLREQALAVEVAYDFAAALRARPGLPPRIISELKKASPSKGLIRADFGVVTLARELDRCGAAALSVLTEPRYFKGSPEYLRAAVGNVSIPVLRKDFVVDPYQIYEARAWGASAVLLIAAALPPPEFRALLRLATELGLAVLSEVHTQEELHWVLDAGAQIIGVNSRDLRTFQTSLETTLDLIAAIPQDRIGVAESAIRTADDIRQLQVAGAQAFLIGETLMRAEHPGDKLKELLGNPSGK